MREQARQFWSFSLNQVTKRELRHRFAGEFETMTCVDDAVEDRISERWVVEIGMPLLDR